MKEMCVLCMTIKTIELIISLQNVYFALALTQTFIKEQNKKILPTSWDSKCVGLRDKCTVPLVFQCSLYDEPQHVPYRSRGLQILHWFQALYMLQIQLNFKLELIHKPANVNATKFEVESQTTLWLVDGSMWGIVPNSFTQIV